MLLAFDVGNTNIVLGVYDADRLLCSWRMATDKGKSADEYGMLINQLFAHEGLSAAAVDDVIISTVVPPILYTLQHLSRKYFHRKPMIVGPGIKTGLTVRYDSPKQLGSDRIVNSAAALEKYRRDLIVIDYGTATTFCAVTEKGEYLGGAIVPGIKISSDALFERTASLPRVELEAPGHVICRNTVEGVQAGVVYGNIGVTERIVAMMKREMQAYTGSDREPLVVATGGLAGLIASGTDCIDKVDKMLTLTGLQVLYEKNRKTRGRKAKQNAELAPGS